MSENAELWSQTPRTPRSSCAMREQQELRTTRAALHYGKRSLGRFGTRSPSLPTNVLSSAVDLKLQNRCQVWCMDIIEHQHGNPKRTRTQFRPFPPPAIMPYTAAWPHGCSLPHEAHGCRASPKHPRRVVVMLHVWVDWDKLRLQTFLNTNNATHMLMYGKQ